MSGHFLTMRDKPLQRLIVAKYVAKLSLFFKLNAEHWVILPITNQL